MVSMGSILIQWINLTRLVHGLWSDIQTVANRVTLSRYGKNLFVMLPLLYTYRRCPYAIRARMALLQAGVGYQAYEVFTAAWVLYGFAAGS